jgi:peptidoglycan/xylan/chitin deacetylase (PgdA/CDA1 family)
VREIEPAAVPRQRLSRSWAIRAAPVGIAGLFLVLVAAVIAASLVGSGLGRSQAAGAIPSATAPSSATAQAIASNHLDSAQPSLGTSPSRTGGFEPAVGWRRPPSCTPLVDVDCRPFVAPTPLPSIAASAGPAFALHVQIFEYHRVKPFAGETDYTRDLIVPPELFTAQMDALAKAGWHTITMGQLGDDLRQRIEPAPKSFVISFDDGYEDGYTYALPILQHYGFVATFFVIGGRIGHEDQLTVGEMRILVASGNEIGNHTMSHEDLRVATPVQLRIEIYGASAAIARAVGVWPQSFAYPIGLTDEMVTDAVASSPGIETAVIQGGSQTETWPNRLTLPRIRVGPGSYPQYLVDRACRYLP